MPSAAERDVADAAASCTAPCFGPYPNGLLFHNRGHYR
jgi:hypothetical protein